MPSWVQVMLDQVRSHLGMLFNMLAEVTARHDLQLASLERRYLAMGAKVRAMWRRGNDIREMQRSIDQHQRDIDHHLRRIDFNTAYQGALERRMDAMQDQMDAMHMTMQP